MQARNGITASYANLTTSLRNVGGVLKDVGGKAKLLASVFSTDVAEGLAQVVDFTGEVIDATSSAIQAVGDVGKSVAKGVADTVQSASAGATAAATAGATAVSMVEKASVVLAVISAALQVATAIANLFNNDGKKQKQIERLQAEIDQLQWELSNTGATRLSAEYGDALEKVRDLYSSTRDEVMALRKESIATGSAWERMFAVARNRGEIFAKTVEKIADAYAKMSYTANKALGEARLDDGRAKLENLAKQQLLVKEQLEAEQGKKKTDNGKVAEYKQKLAEIGNQMAEALNEPLEKIIGSSAESLASELGNAFFDAAKAGEDAMEGWHKKTNEIVGDILRRMLITQYLEPEIGRIFNTYKNRWFDERGAFRGIDEVKRSSADLAKEIEAVGEKFKAQYGILEEVNKKFITEDGGRTPSQKGIATASQDSIDELNGRMTAVQGHTFAISEHTRQLTATTGLILQSIVNIESETNGFGARLEATPQWKDLLIICVADHGYSELGSDDRNSTAVHHIPLLWIGGAVRSPRVVDALMTQSDLSATLLAQLGLSYRSFTFARNVLAPNYTYPFAYYTFNDGFGFIDSTGVTVMDNVSGRGIEVTPAPSENRKAPGRATLLWVLR